MKEKYLIRISPEKKSQLESLIGYKLEETFKYKKVRPRYNQMDFQDLLPAIRAAAKAVAKYMKEEKLFDNNNIEHWKKQVVESTFDIEERRNKILGKNYLPAN